ncbi:uncharacterized protein LOC113562345 isoform X2 [Ooceraea biroi]|uniref:uncharacterized protein LOC113562345 isoform X2 n=1 Tax=Ooceraea biroi TaxID=2015173 RepID=UPI000F0831B5|nr:uncharacterized protein LOC113562345 isoform X2 [Ooceraea biroi]
MAYASHKVLRQCTCAGPNLNMRKNAGREKVNPQNSPSKLYLGVRVTYERLGLTSRYRPVRLMKRERERELSWRYVVARRSRQDGLSADVNLTRTIHEDTSSRASFSFAARTCEYHGTFQYIAPDTSPVSLDAPILRQGSRLRERATMPNGANLGYTCVNDLMKQARVNCAGKKPRSVYQRLPTMRQKFEMAKKNGDYKTAYILLKRWLDTVKWLKKTQDYKDRKSIYSTNMTVDQT